MREHIRYAHIWPACGPVLIHGFKTAPQARKAVESLGFEFLKWTNFIGCLGWVDPGFEIGPDGITYYRDCKEMTGPLSAIHWREYSKEPFIEPAIAAIA